MVQASGQVQLASFLEAKENVGHLLLVGDGPVHCP